MSAVNAAMHATTGLAGFIVGLCFMLVALGFWLLAVRVRSLGHIPNSVSSDLEALAAEMAVGGYAASQKKLSAPAWQIQWQGRNGPYVLTLVHSGRRIERSLHSTKADAMETRDAALGFYGALS